MTDVETVVAQLKLTPKGKLSYNEKNWKTVLTETSAVPKLNVSPFVIKSISRIGTKNVKERDFEVRCCF